MRPVKLERHDLVAKVQDAISTGRYRILPHARQRCTERQVAAPDIEYALECGHPVPRRDRYDEGGRSWSYCFEGPTVDREPLRVIVAFEDLMLVVTVVRLTARRRLVMAEMLFMELGFPVKLINPPMARVHGKLVPDINMRDLQHAVFGLLVVKPSRLTGAQVRFIRKHVRLRQSDLAEVLNLANHSPVSQWESREDEPAGMDYNTEVLLRIWMSTKDGHEHRIMELLESKLKRLEPTSQEPLEVQIPTAV